MSSIKFKNYTLSNSIVFQSDFETIVSALDKDAPFTFAEWREQISTPVIDVDLKHVYTEYLTQWAEVKRQSGDLKSANNTKALFKSFLQQLPVDATQDELRYINNIDYDNKYEIEAALKFFTSKIKSNVFGVMSNRQQIEFQTTKNSMRGSTAGVAMLIKDFIISLLLNNDIINDKEIAPDVKQKIIQELTVHVVELYDMTKHPSNMIDYDPYLHIQQDVALQNVLRKYGNVLANSNDVMLTTDTNVEVDLVFTPDVSKIDNLPSSEFVDYQPTTEPVKLNIENVKQIVELSVGTRMQFLVNDTTTNRYEIGTLFDSSNNLNRFDVKYDFGINFSEPIAASRSNHIGEFYKPTKIGKMKYYSYAAKPEIKQEHLKSEQVYVFPDLDNYGSQRLDLPVDYQENFEFVKNNTLESGKPGEITSSIKNFPRFNGYQSYEETVSVNTQGISRKDDSFDFWTGSIDSIWANQDVFDLEIANTFDHASRQISRLSNVGQVYDWKPDSYGNEFGLIKKTKPSPGLTIEDFTDPPEIVSCRVMNGDAFKTLSRQDPPVTLIVNELPDNFSSYNFTHVANCMLFSDVGCDFSPVEIESVVISATELPEGLLYCEFLDGYMMTFDGRYDEYSTNDSMNFELDPTIELVWDCMDFNSACLPKPNTDVHYKLSDVVLYDDPSLQHVRTEFETVESVKRVSLSDQIDFPGSVVVRTHDSSSIGSFETVCKYVFESLPQSIQHEVSNTTNNIDVIGDVLIIETTDSLIFNHVITDFITSEIKPLSNPVIIPKKSTELNNYIVSDWFYNETTGQIVIASLNTSADDVYNTSDQVITDVHMYWLNTKNFKLIKTKPVLDWYVSEDSVISKSVADITSLKLCYSETLNRYYATFLCYLSQDQAPAAFTIGQVIIVSENSSTGDINMYSATQPAMIKDSSRTSADKVHVSKVSRTVNPVRSSATGYNSDIMFENSIKNTMILDLTKLSPGKTATSVTIDFGDGSPVYRKYRLPQIRYDQIDQLVGSDTRNPLDYRVEHVYVNNTQQHTCTITVNTIDTPGQPDEYLVRVIQKQSDITTAFNPLSSVNDIEYRLDQPGISIHKSRVFTDKFGAENMFLILRTSMPEYLVPVIIKLAQPLRRSTVFDMTADQITETSLIDRARIDRTYDLHLTT